MKLSNITQYFQHENSSAVVLMFSAILALALSNSPWHFVYTSILKFPMLLHVTNEGLMTLFFLLVGLEIKYELMFGVLNTKTKAMLPAMAAAGGMLVPAIIYSALNFQHAEFLQGWAIPTATDIAFSLGVLSLLGNRIHVSLKIFLMALAIFDDLAAIIVIAVFYTANISFLFLGFSCCCIAIMWLLNKRNITSVLPYLIVGALLWACLYFSGVHVTLAGVVTALFIPVKKEETCSALRLKHGLHPFVAFAILPLFAFMNAGVSLTQISFADIQWTLVLGIIFGLFIGKQIGVFGFCWLSVKYFGLSLPEKMHWKNLYAVSVLCGIGFTISLFIGTLAFGNDASYLDSVKIGVITGSLISGIVGYLLLKIPE